MTERVKYELYFIDEKHGWGYCIKEPNFDTVIRRDCNYKTKEEAAEAAEKDLTLCPRCYGVGKDDNWYGCSDPNCCGTDMCYYCDGTGRIEEEENE